MECLQQRKLNRTVSVSWWWVASGLFLVVWLLVWRQKLDRTAAGLVLAAVAAAGGAWYHAYWNLYASAELGLFARSELQPACIEAIALRVPRLIPAPELDPLQTMQAGDRSRLEVQVTAIRDGPTW